ncbi:MAG: SPFH domain-containing protein, partial [Desulfurococcales archaeon]|nr:SPFH domain-containing protein [Desulfurococcales archaeon]
MVLDKFGKILGKAATGLGEKKPYVIKWPEHLDPEQYIAWRYPHTDIPFLSVVIVDEAQKALFFRDGKLMGVLDSGRHTLDTQNIPFLRGLVEGAYGETIFKATIVFVNLRQYHENFGGRAFVDAVGVHLLFNGTYYYTVDENRLELFYVRLMGTKDELTKDDVKAKVTPFINRNLIELFGEYAVEQMRQGRYIQNVSDFMAMLSEFGEGVKAKIAQRVNDYFGLKITDVLIETLDISEEDKRILQMSGPRAFAAMYERDWAGREAISKNLAQAKGTAGTVAPFMMFPWMMYPPY